MLTPEQITSRKLGIGASEAKQILSGNWADLWMVKTGRAESISALDPWSASVRHALEPLVMDDYETRVGRKVIQRGASVVHSEHSFMRCTLDGLDPEIGPVDAKALSIWTRDVDQWLIDMYSGQMQHQMFCCDTKKGALHVSVGMARPQSMFFERDDFFLTEYLDLCTKFWGFVERDEPPPGCSVTSEPVSPEKMREVDLSTNNAWVSAAADYINHQPAAKLFKTAEADLKNMIEPDVKRAFGGGLEINRSKNGALRFKEMKNGR